MSPFSLATPRLLAAALCLLAPALVAAQGRLIPRPCLPERCPPPRCPAVRCRAPEAPEVVRTASDVRVELVGRVLHYTVEERFRNRGGRIGEADFLFPLPKGAAFQDLRLSIDGELVAGEVLPAERARAIYEEIVRRERDPALVEWMGRGLLRARVFPIAAGEERRVVVRFQSVAEREGDALRVDYFRGTPEASVTRPVAGRGWRDADDGDDRFAFVYRPEDGYGTPYSPTHALHGRADGDRRVLRAEGSARDVVILVPARRGDRASVAAIAHAPGREEGYALITLAPPTLRGRPTPRDVTLVLDVSGSMAGAKLAQAKAAGKRLLATLRPEDRFRIVDFASEVHTFRDEAVAATPANVREAGRYLDSLEAEGGTNIEGALREALGVPGGRYDPPTFTPAEPPVDSAPGAPDERRPRGGRLPLVLFMTDGAPTVGERSQAGLARIAAAARAEVRLFTFGVGADVNVSLLEELALDGRGTAHFVRPDESVERVVGVVARRLTTPVATGLRLRAEGVRLSRVYPSGPIDLFDGQDVVVLARYAGHGAATLRFVGEAGGDPVAWEQSVELPERQRGNAFVARLWATQRAGYLSAERRRNGPSAELDTELRDLGLRFGIPTELTSYLVQEPAIVAAGVAPEGGVARPRTARPGSRAEGTSTGNTRGRIGDTGPQLQGAVVAGAARAPVTGEEAFRRARVASEMRDAQSLAAVDTLAAADASADVRRVGPRTFVRRGDVWTDVGYQEGVRTVTIKPYSAAWFALVERLPELRAPFALGERVLVAGRAAAVAVAPGGVERLADGALDALERDW